EARLPDRALAPSRSLGGPAKTLRRRRRPQAGARRGRPTRDAGIPGADEVDAPIHSADGLHRPEEVWWELLSGKSFRPSDLVPPFPRTTLAPYTKIVASLSMQCATPGSSRVLPPQRFVLAAMYV